MPKAQVGICAEPNLHGMYLFFNVLDGKDASLRTKLSQFIELQHEMDTRFSEALITSFVAIGTQYWAHCYPHAIPNGLSGFLHLQQEKFDIAAQPFDLFVQIRSDRIDANHIFCQRVLALFAHDVELVAQINAFRFLDGRDFNGFFAAPDTPFGKQKRLTGLINNLNSAFDQGSFVHVLRYVHQLDKWQQLNTTEQERIMGRNKQTGELLMPLHADSHTVRSELKDEKGQPQLLNQGMPFANAREQGMLQVTCSGDGQAFNQMLRSQVGDAMYWDAWLDFTKADMGSAYFAPPQAFFSHYNKVFGAD